MNLANFVNYFLTLDFWHNFWWWHGWTALSSIVLAITIVFIYFQARYTKMLAKFTIMPTAFFVLRSARTIYNYNLKKSKNLNALPDEEIPKENLSQWRRNGKFRIPNFFIVRNDSKFPILFYIKIKFHNNGIIKLVDHFWKHPLQIYPGLAQYPEVFVLDQNLFSDIENPKDKKIIAEFEYRYAPVFEPKLKSDKMTQKWTFNLEKYEWIGPDGVRDIGLMY